MGLFDRVKIDDRLDLKLKKADATTINKATGNNDWKKEFQTKDLENWMQDFSIDSKGKLWIYEDPKDKRKRKKYPHTGEIDVYTIITNDENDHDVDVNVKLNLDNGVTKSIKTSVTKHSNETRLKNQELFEANRKKYDALRQSFIFKCYRVLYKVPVSFILGLLTRVFYKLSIGCQRLRLKIMPW